MTQQYLMSVCHEDEYDLDFDTEDMRRIGPQVAKYNDELTAAGKWVFGGGLMPASHAVVFRPSPDAPMTDGPFAEAKEQVGGFWVITADTVEEARDWARRASLACELPVELRPFQAGE
jgi:hypothetical protein